MGHSNPRLLYLHVLLSSTTCLLKIDFCSCIGCISSSFNCSFWVAVQFNNRQVCEIHRKRMGVKCTILYGIGIRIPLAFQKNRPCLESHCVSMSHPWWCSSGEITQGLNVLLLQKYFSVSKTGALALNFKTLYCQTYCQVLWKFNKRKQPVNVFCAEKNLRSYCEKEEHSAKCFLLHSISGHKHPFDKSHSCDPSSPNMVQLFLTAAWLVSLAFKHPLQSTFFHLTVSPGHTDFLSVLPPCLFFFPIGHKQKSLQAVALFPRQGWGHGIHRWLWLSYTSAELKVKAITGLSLPLWPPSSFFSLHKTPLSLLPSWPCFPLPLRHPYMRFFLFAIINTFLYFHPCIVLHSFFLSWFAWLWVPLVFCSTSRSMAETWHVNKALIRYLS